MTQESQSYFTVVSFGTTRIDPGLLLAHYKNWISLPNFEDLTLMEVFFKYKL